MALYQHKAMKISSQEAVMENTLTTLGKSPNKISILDAGCYINTRFNSVRFVYGSDHVMRGAVVVLTLFAGILLGLTALLAYQRQKPAVTSALIAFTAQHPTLSGEIYTIRFDGSGQHNLTQLATWDGDPAWSFDGEWIVFTSRTGRESGIYIISADGKVVQRLTENTRHNGEPGWLPDGKHLIFMSNVGGTRQTDIYVMRLDGTIIQRLTQSLGWEGDPTWTEDGQWVAFSSGRAGNAEIFIMPMEGADRGDAFNLTQNGMPWDDDPAWSPDGERLAFVSNRDGDFEIYSMRRDGSEVRQLTHNTVRDSNPAWSRDGDWIAFSSDRDGNSELYVMRQDGSDVRRLTVSAVDEYSPAWSPAIDVHWRSWLNGVVGLLLLMLRQGWVYAIRPYAKE